MRLQKYLQGKDPGFQIEILSNLKKVHYHFMNINEMMDKNIKLETPEWDGTIFSIKFEIHDKIYTFKARQNGPGEFGIQFWGSGIDFLNIKGDKRYTGDVFAAVVKSLHMLISKKTVTSFYFSTEEKKLKSLYDKLINRIEKEFKGFKFEYSKEYDGFKFWIFKKK